MASPYISILHTSQRHVRRTVVAWRQQILYKSEETAVLQTCNLARVTPLANCQNRQVTVIINHLLSELRKVLPEAYASFAHHPLSKLLIVVELWQVTNITPPDSQMIAYELLRNGKQTFE